MGFIDIHTHIIPDVDDGAESLRHSLERISFLMNKGIDHIVATPHKRSSLFNFDGEKVKQNFNQLVSTLDNEKIGVKVSMGAEYYFGVDLFEDIQNGSVYTLGNSRYILVEFPSFRFTKKDREGIFKVLTSGYRIVVAHIERHRFSSESFSTLEYLRDNSALFQCDIMSLSGLWGEQVRLFMEELIKRRYVDIISTDTHCKEFEDELLSKSFNRASELLGNDFMERYMGDSIKQRLGLL